jgi:hypothetical protein
MIHSGNIKIGNDASNIVPRAILKRYFAELVELMSDFENWPGNICVRRHEIIYQQLGYSIYISASKGKKEVAGMIFTKKDLEDIKNKEYQEFVRGVIDHFDYNHPSVN